MLYVFLIFLMSKLLFDRPVVAEIDTQIYRAGHPVFIRYIGAVDATERVVKTYLQFIDSGFGRADVQTCSGCQAPIEGVGDGAALVPDAVADLRTEVEDPPASFGTEIEVHQDRELDVVQVVERLALGVVIDRPSAVHVVQLHLEMAVFMSRKTERDTSVTTRRQGARQRTHTTHGRLENDRTGRETTMYTYPVFRHFHAGLGGDRCGQQHDD